MGSSNFYYIGDGPEKGYQYFAELFFEEIGYPSIRGNTREVPFF